MDRYFHRKNICRLPIWIFLVFPIGGISFLSAEFLYLSVSEYFLIFTILILGILNKQMPSISVVVILFFFFIYVALTAVPILWNDNLFWILKNLKPYLFILIVAVFLFLTDKISLVSKNRLILIVAAAISIDAFTWAILIFAPEYMPEGIRKEFFIRNNVYRYFDVSILFIQSIIIYCFWAFKKDELIKFTLLIAYSIMVLLTQDRVFMLFGGVAFFIYSGKLVKVFLLIFLIISISTVGVLFDDSNTTEAAGRFYSLLNYSLIFDELYSRFILPAKAAGYELSLGGLIFGEGIDFRFYVPWYKYRGLDPYHNSVDSFFVTFFVKHGVLGLVVYFAVIHQGIKKYPVILYVWILSYLSMHNGLYVNSFLIMLVLSSSLYGRKIFIEK